MSGLQLTSRSGQRQDKCAGQTRNSAQYELHRHAADLKARIAKQLHITKPDFVVFVPEVTDAGVNDTGNEHFLVFDGPDGSLMAVWTQELPPRRSRTSTSPSRAARTRARPGRSRASSPGRRSRATGHMASWGYPLVSKKGRIYVLYSQHIGKTDCFVHHTGWLHGIYSDDNGATWSKPQNVPGRAQHQRQPRPDHAAEHALLAETAAARQGRQVFRRLHALDQFRRAEEPRPNRWISADSRVEFMRFENVDDNPEPRDLKISWFMSNEKALAVPFPGHPGSQRLPGTDPS